ncbi:hypothetical protein Tco_1441811 [Tanacetum coccineum]
MGSRGDGVDGDGVDGGGVEGFRQGQEIRNGMKNEELEFMGLCKDRLAAQGKRRYDVVMTGNNQNMVDRPSPSFTTR